MQDLSISRPQDECLHRCMHIASTVPRPNIIFCTWLSIEIGFMLCVDDVIHKLLFWFTVKYSYTSIELSILFAPRMILD